MPSRQHPTRSCVRLLFAALVALPAAAAAQDDDPGRQIFVEEAQPPCGLCHTLADAGTSGAIGPNLDSVKPTKDRAELAIREGINAMPSYAETLTPEQIEAVADYVSRVAGR